MVKAGTGDEGGPLLYSPAVTDPPRSLWTGSTGSHARTPRSPVQVPLLVIVCHVAAIVDPAGSEDT